MIDQASNIELWVGTALSSYSKRAYGLIVQYQDCVSQHHAVHQEDEAIAVIIHAINRVIYNINEDDFVGGIVVYSTNVRAYHHRMAAIETYQYEIAQGVKRDALANIDLFLEYRVLSGRFNVKFATATTKRDRARLLEARQMAKEIIENDGKIGEQDQEPMFSHNT